mmetsp:Transcript_117597/g.226880  ORF Transcript_117597/g.226880 Transcript_117597/m.226880 type:complete len:302 (+) Transcript_117597:69-974(+)
MDALPSDLKALTVPELKALAGARGVKQAGVGWPTCCPPKGTKKDIIEAIMRSDQASCHTKPMQDGNEVMEANLDALTAGMKKLAVSDSRDCTEEGSVQADSLADRIQKARKNPILDQPNVSLTVSSDYRGFKSWSQVEREIVDALCKLDESLLPKVCIIAGVAGSGKTTTMREKGAKRLVVPQDIGTERDDKIVEMLSGASEVTFEIGGSKLATFERVNVLVEKTGGDALYLDVPMEEVRRRRQARLSCLTEDDRRGEAQLRGTLHAPETTPEFFEALKLRLPSLKVRRSFVDNVVAHAGA